MSAVVFDGGGCRRWTVVNPVPDVDGLLLDTGDRSGRANRCVTKWAPAHRNLFMSVECVERVERESC